VDIHPLADMSMIVNTALSYAYVQKKPTIARSKSLTSVRWVTKQFKVNRNINISKGNITTHAQQHNL